MDQNNDRRTNIRAAVGAILIAILMHMNDFFTGAPIRIALNILIYATFVSRFLLRDFWRTPRMSIVFVVLAALETAAGIIWFEEKVLIYFLAVIIVTTAIRLSLGPRRVPLLATMITVAGVYAAFGHVNVLSFTSFVIITIFFYINVQSRRQRDAIFEENKRNLVELQEAYTHLQEASVTSMHNAVLDERTRIARDIHDAVGHSLTSLIVQMQALRYMIAKDPAQAEQSLTGMLEVARQGLQDIRTSVHALADDRSVSGLAPLRALLARMEATTAITYDFQADALTEEDVDAADSTLLFSIMQEAITNIVRHARATHVRVRISQKAGRIVLHIRDNGHAVADEPIQEGFGLKMMRARLEEGGGILKVGAGEPHGLEITAELPIGAADTEMREHDNDDNIDR
ncbi:signal transduction histidine kinase [Paenibacillus cellulosilyticus]|uniref:histidine kinase n=1 Tax=Paenibacillus cellulosilyticus TaxID=375489 RepID=A0A2V2YUF3_9BACL|nr:sensor histidine kinase [Paenibacillus cellulosilyticus]PWW00891.1 signal transduction histidine kinase [Paenibacillus cellulosilyticus]QKS47549.1 sensor histidine kinase [Paenibacillus cellulosilyticus]